MLALLGLCLGSSGCASSRENVVHVFHKTEYQHLQAGESFTAPTKGIFASDEVAADLLGITREVESEVLKREE